MTALRIAEDELDAVVEQFLGQCPLDLIDLPLPGPDPGDRPLASGETGSGFHGSMRAGRRSPCQGDHQETSRQVADAPKATNDQSIRREGAMGRENVTVSSESALSIPVRRLSGFLG
jgi:hypothetical protein